MDVSIVVPVYNEEDNIALLHRGISDVMNQLDLSYEIVMVNDGSTDSTAKLLDMLAGAYPEVRAVHFTRNFGQTPAMSAGIDEASGDVIVTMDGDLQNDPTDIPRMLAKLNEGYDLVHGWRRDRQDHFWTRKVPSKIANRLIATATRFPVRDLGCTLKAMRSHVAQNLQLYGEMHRFIPILAHWRGARCVEIETCHHPRRFGQTKYGLSRTFRVVLDLLTVKFLTQYSTAPMRLFGTVGLGCSLLATACAVAVILMKLLAGFDMSGNPLLYVSLFGFMIGMQFFSLGMLGEMNARIYYESRDKKTYAIERITQSPRSLRKAA